MSNNYAELREAASEATRMNFDSAEVACTDADGEVECPCCNGEGLVELVSDYCNIDGVALGVQFYGIGKEHLNAERYYRAASPQTILNLLDEAESLRNRPANESADKTPAPGREHPLPVNRFGVDRDYFHRKLAIILRDLNNYTGPELARTLGRLAMTASAETLQEAEFRLPTEREGTGNT